ncbi:flagellar basal-body MS-ring/collar protein FliF [Microbacterium sp. STN6]|uniref:flagellar basal-body MS-ring/collar protein FliF n=1 Tax=Microbacterium sp. STN6 TaxID=2995588 RepID=UPI0022608853|nr:flagellar basal-body MS-ring/collar protein FliF [Microbacterium sp. STN6]MCX7522379.1 flagellar basal-body MS-ring/collar protein FliF [Microbacterium sp. STN6]
MPAAVTSVLSRLGATIRGFSIAQRTIAIIGIAVVVLGAIALTSWLAKPSYTPLFSGLSGSDANAIVEQLRTDGVSYELANGGGTVLVPEASVYDERLKAAAAGLPSSSTGGYALLDKMGVTSSEFQQSVTYKRAIEGELAKTISAMKGVQTASVQLAIPKETVFTSQKTDPTASVFIETQAGVSLTTDQVQAIVHLTSASIDDMKPTDVAVIDSRGTVLSAVGTGVNGSTDQQAGDYQERVRTAVQSMLDKVVGTGNATVVVAADVNQESATRTETSYSQPTSAPSINESTTKETYSGTGAGSSGVLGPDNIAVPNGSTSDGSYNSESTTKNNAIDQVTETRNIPSGAIARQTVSVAVDSAAAKGINVADLTSLVSAAAGVDTARGDKVSVKVVDFSHASAKEAAKALDAAKAQDAADQFAGIVKTVIITLGILITLALGLILYARRSRRQHRETVEDWTLTEAVPSLASGAATLPLTAPAAQPAAVPAAPTLPSLGEASDVERRRAEIGALAEQDPSRAADFLRSMMDERQNA